MAPTVFGLHLGPPEFRWGKFKSSYMFKNRDYHLRRTKFAVYQLAMILCVISESLGTAALSDYVDQQKYADNLIDENGQKSNGEYNDDYVGCASFNIFCGIFVAFIFGAAFFFDLFWPERHEDRGIKIAWKGCSIAACVLLSADVALMTWVTSSREAYITGPNGYALEQALRDMGRYPLVYRENGRAIASLVFLWPGWLATIASTVIMWKSIIHNDTYGPFSTHARMQREKLAEPSSAHVSEEAVANEAMPPHVGLHGAERPDGQYVGSAAAGVAGQSVPQAAHLAN